MVNQVADSVLVVEDNQEMQDLLKVLLEHASYSVTSASKGSDALKILKSTSEFSLILLDMTLADMGWRTFLEKLNDEGLGKDIPIVFCSAAPEIERMKLPFGVVGVIRKPFVIKDFLQKTAMFKRTVEPRPRQNSSEITAGMH